MKDIRSMFVVETVSKENNIDKRLFEWAKKIEDIGYEVSQIWEDDISCSEECYKGINFSMKNSDLEGILLITDKDKTIWVEVDEGFLTKEDYVKFIHKLIQ